MSARRQSRPTTASLANGHSEVLARGIPRPLSEEERFIARTSRDAAAVLVPGTALELTAALVSQQPWHALRRIQELARRELVLRVMLDPVQRCFPQLSYTGEPAKRFVEVIESLPGEELRQLSPLGRNGLHP